MITHLSNTATQSEIETYLGIPFLFQNIYKPQIIINGREETSAILVTSGFPDAVQFGIWGILPKNYSQAWQHFQNYEISLSTDLETIQPEHWLYGALKERRCYIIVTGYFNYFLKNKNLQPWFSSKDSQKAFCLAGVYNKTDDGFITFTLLTKKSTHFQIKTSFTPILPIILAKKERELWIGNHIEPDALSIFLENISSPNLKQHAVNPAIMGKGKKTLQMLEPYTKK
ncbi:SOS response-associated peptidase family protein [Aequorivita sp. SDUM287046]|uniref:Abasic site processing protein n=1 Tax=Aequorivita aurantiaca TaxID=3053356 RepID=A0ABT8DJN6_9FLAO|nr:SOS response-associated peptidase family protein [Aequorivita aurantiaca]MDN3724146.1 SOS response-associated peptidase family protein [Aequorivita aurantiaca]